MIITKRILDQISGQLQQALQIKHGGNLTANIVNQGQLGGAAFQFRFGLFAGGDIGEGADVAGKFATGIIFRDSLPINPNGAAIGPQETIFGAVNLPLANDLKPASQDFFALCRVNRREPAVPEGFFRGQP